MTNDHRLVIRILFVEDDPGDFKLISLLLGRSVELNVSIQHVTSLRDAIVALHEGSFDLILLDLGLPDSFGIESLPRLRATSPETAIVVLTGDDDGDIALEAIRSGAQEYLSKQQLVGRELSRVVQHSMARQGQRFEIEAQALTDALTEIANRRAAELEINRRLGEFNQHGRQFSIAIIDVDYFKRVNDTWGHDAGDQILRGVAGILHSQVSEIDTVARFGGEEFVAVLPATDLKEALDLANRMRIAVQDSTWTCGQAISVTISVGVTQVSKNDDLRKLLARADQALYAAKAQGRNRCVTRSNSSLPQSSVGRIELGGANQATIA